MPQLDGMSFFSQFIWFSIVFTTIYALILRHAMCSIATNLKFRMKNLDSFSNILTADSKGIFYLGIIPLHSRYDTFILNSTTFCSSSICIELIHESYNSFNISIQKFNNTKLLSGHAVLVASVFDNYFKTKSTIIKH